MEQYEVMEQIGKGAFSSALLVRHRTEKKNPPPKNTYKDPDDGKQRFLLELEFMQCLANPTYIHYLAQNRYFEDEAFIGYL